MIDWTLFAIVHMGSHSLLWSAALWKEMRAFRFLGEINKKVLYYDIELYKASNAIHSSLCEGQEFYTQNPSNANGSRAVRRDVVIAVAREVECHATMSRLFRDISSTGYEEESRFTCTANTTISLLIRLASPAAYYLESGHQNNFRCHDPGSTLPLVVYPKR